MKLQTLVKVHEPQRVTLPAESDSPYPQFFSGETIDRPLVMPKGDGYVTLKVKIEDTPDGWHKHLSEQKEVFGFDPPAHPYHPSWRKTVDVWEVQWVVEEKSGKAQLRCEDYTRSEAVNAVADELAHKVREWHPEAQIRLEFQAKDDATHNVSEH